MADPLADVIATAMDEKWRRQWGTATDLAKAVRSAGYKSPEDIAAVLDEAQAKDWDKHGRRPYADVFDNLRAALLGGGDE